MNDDWTPDQSATSERTVEDRILSLLRRHGALTFTSLAEAMPEHQWQTLLTTLNILRERRLVRLSALTWDYSIALSTPPARRDGQAPQRAASPDSPEERSDT